MKPTKSIPLRSRLNRRAFPTPRKRPSLCAPPTTSNPCASPKKPNWSSPAARPIKWTRRNCKPSGAATGGIEAIHYVREVTFGEDASTVRTGHAPQNLAALRHAVIGLCALDAARQHKRKSYLPRFRNAANNDHQVAVDLLSRPLLHGS